MRWVDGGTRTALPLVAVLVAAVGAAFLIGASRLMLGVHSLPEVVLGGAVGLAGAIALARLAGPPPRPFRARWIAAVVVLVLVIFHGQRLPAEARIGGIAYTMAQELRVCRGSPTWAHPEWDQDRPYLSSSRTMSSSPK
jgi:hypothetical protein